MWTLAGQSLKSRLLIGTALYPTPKTMLAAIRESAAEIITVSLRRQSPQSQGGNDFWQLIKDLNCQILPNTAGCYSAKEAIATAHMARELFKSNWIKLEVLGDDYTLQPDPIGLLDATAELIKQGFEVFPYTTYDLVIAQKLVALGCNIIMPCASPIGSGQGLVNRQALKTLRHRLPKTKLIIDAGIGKPSHAVQAMELGYDGVLLNSAVALATDPVGMGRAFKYALRSGRQAYESGMMQARDLASSSTPTIGTPFWHNE